ncbi:class I SAM-dependent methyltransferase [Micromonospora sp. NPDC006766]|uniref:class I SAM-dependent methyltransferase n=1 Tax=Micromonospora sp. NPDC006766 TaxID=3154778 RepID=UPI0033C1E2AE
MHRTRPIAAPIFGVNLNRPLRRADREPAARVLDLGCGEGARALQALAHYPDGHADGVDLSPYALERAAGAAAERGLAHRLTCTSGTPDVRAGRRLRLGAVRWFDTRVRRIR